MNLLTQIQIFSIIWSNVLLSTLATCSIANKAQLNSSNVKTSFSPPNTLYAALLCLFKLNGYINGFFYITHSAFAYTSLPSISFLSDRMQIWSLPTLQKMYNQKCKNQLWLWWKADWSVSTEACLILSKAVWSSFHICICKGPIPRCFRAAVSLWCTWLTVPSWLMLPKLLTCLTITYLQLILAHSKQELSLRPMEMAMYRLLTIWCISHTKIAKAPIWLADFQLPKVRVHMFVFVNYMHFGD